MKPDTSPSRIKALLYGNLEEVKHAFSTVSSLNDPLDMRELIDEKWSRFQDFLNCTSGDVAPLQLAMFLLNLRGEQQAERNEPGHFFYNEKRYQPPRDILKSLEFLLDHGTNPHQKYNYYPLVFACIPDFAIDEEHLKALQIFVSHGAKIEPNQKQPKDFDFFKYALGRINPNVGNPHYLTMIQWLLDSGKMDPNFPPDKPASFFLTETFDIISRQSNYSPSQQHIVQGVKELWDLVLPYIDLDKKPESNYPCFREYVKEFTQRDTVLKKFWEEKLIQREASLLRKKLPEVENTKSALRL